MKITISPTRQVDLSLGLLNALTKKACENAVQGLGNEAGTKRGKRRKGNRKGRGETED